MKCVKCRRSIQGHKWARIKAHAAGWYFTKEGAIYCPDHRPEWAPPLDAARPDTVRESGRAHARRSPSTKDDTEGGAR